MSKKITQEEFFDQVQSGKLLNDKQRLYSHIKKHPGITLGNLSRATKIVLQTASARVSDLMDMGIVEVPVKQSEIGMIKVTSNGCLIVQENPEKILENKKNRSAKKFHRCVNSVLAYDEHLTDDLKIQLQSLLPKRK